MKLTRIQQRNQRRKEIMQAAQHLFCQRGIPETTLVDIAEASGTTRATVYKYFETKELILKALLEELLSDLVVAFGNMPRIEVGSESLASENKQPFEVFRGELKEFVYQIFCTHKEPLQLLYGYNFIYTDENPGPPLRISHLLVGKGFLQLKAREKDFARMGIQLSKEQLSTHIQVFLESLLGLAGQLAGRGRILEDIKGISPKVYLDTMVDIFLNSLLV